jgi:hypothetical protein
MNHKIRELSEQAEVFARHIKHRIEFMHKREMSAQEYQDQYTECFAELLVRNSAELIEGKFDFYGDESLVADTLLEHWGFQR